jgi:hypothetical protein
MWKIIDFRISSLVSRGIGGFVTWFVARVMASDNKGWKVVGDFPSYLEVSEEFYRPAALVHIISTQCVDAVKHSVYHAR